MPALPTFAVDDGFSYRVPEELSDVTVGSIVRVPLGGRRVKGYVTHVRSAEPQKPLKDVLGVVGELPIFSDRLLETLRWAAIHYVAPVATLLGRPGPPNSPRRHAALPMTVAADIGYMQSKFIEGGATVLGLRCRISPESCRWGGSSRRPPG